MGFTQGCGASELLMFVVGRGGMGENIWFNPEPPGLVACGRRAYGGEGDPEPSIDPGVGWQRAGWKLVWDGQDLGIWQSNAGRPCRVRSSAGSCPSQGLVALCMASS